MSDAPNENRSASGQFVKGQSGNPKGRPKGFGALIRELTDDGVEMVNLALKVMRGTLTVKVVDGHGDVMEAEPTIKERLEALKWLAAYGFGKPVEHVEAEIKQGGLMLIKLPEERSE